MTYAALKDIEILLPKQALYQAELCPDTSKAQSLRAWPPRSQPGCDTKGGTIRQHPQPSPEPVPKSGMSCSCHVRLACSV